MRTSLIKLALGLAAAEGPRLVRHAISRRAAIAQVPPAYRSPMLFLPLSVTNRAALRLLREGLASTDVREGIRHDVRRIPATNDGPSVSVHTYQRPDRIRPSGALLWVHGGGFIAGDVAGGHAFCSRVADETGVLVVAVEYRLAPEHPFPAALDDCYAGLCWVHEQADVLGVDHGRIAVGGESAGGGLAACLAQKAHDRGDVPVCAQILVYPMLDDRTVLRADQTGGQLVWTAASNRYGWTSYLGRPPHADAPPPYAAAARRENLAGLPPAWIGIGTLDLFHREDVDYAHRLQAAGVDCDLLVVPGMYHGMDALTHAVEPDPMAVFDRLRTAAIRRALAP